MRRGRPAAWRAVALMALAACTEGSTPTAVDRGQYLVDGGTAPWGDAQPAEASLFDAGLPDTGCVAATCAEQGFNCGTALDGCGGIVRCGSCTAPETCGGGGTANVCAVATYTVSITIQGSPVADSTSVSVRATGTGPGVDHVSFYRMAGDDARDAAKLCNYPSTWEVIDHDHPSASWKPWVPPKQVGEHYLVVNLKDAANAAVCSGPLALAQHLGVSCSALAQQYTPCQGGFLEVDVLLPQPFDAGPHPNFVPYYEAPTTYDWTAKFYWLKPSAIPAEQHDGKDLNGLWVWSGPWGDGTRFVAYQKYWDQSSFPRKTNNAYLFRELERWDGASVMGYPGKCHDPLGADYACLVGEESPDATLKNRRYSSSPCTASSHGVRWPNNQTKAYAAVDQYTGASTCTKGAIVSYVREWWGTAGSAFRQQRCDEYLPASLPQGQANAICKASPNVAKVYQRYISPPSYGCEGTIYAWGHASTPADTAFRNGELLFTEYLGFSGFSAAADAHHLWNPKCEEAFTLRRNWYYTGAYNIVD